MNHFKRAFLIVLLLVAGGSVATLAQTREKEKGLKKLDVPKDKSNNAGADKTKGMKRIAGGSNDVEADEEVDIEEDMDVHIDVDEDDFDMDFDFDFDFDIDHDIDIDIPEVPEVPEIEIEIPEIEIPEINIDIDFEGLGSLRSLESLKSLQSLESLKQLENLDEQLQEQLGDLDEKIEEAIQNSHHWRNWDDDHRRRDKKDERSKGLKKIE